MALVIKYKKIDANNIQKYHHYDENINKTDLLTLKANYLSILALNDATVNLLIKDFFIAKDLDAFDALIQEKIDAIDDLLDLYNNTTTPETINWIDE